MIDYAVSDPVAELPADFIIWATSYIWPSAVDDYMEYVAAAPYRYKEWEQDHWKSFHEYQVWEETYRSQQE